MKLTILVLAALISIPGHATDHSHLAKHNMVLFGTAETFASHIVYKIPHNYQVILELGLSNEAREKYLSAKGAFPESLFVLLLDPNDISRIESAPEITGTIYRIENNRRIEIAAGVRVSRKDFRMIYFDELPLSLEADKN